MNRRRFIALVGLAPFAGWLSRRRNADVTPGAFEQTWTAADGTRHTMTVSPLGPPVVSHGSLEEFRRDFEELGRAMEEDQPTGEQILLCGGDNWEKLRTQVYGPDLSRQLMESLRS